MKIGIDATFIAQSPTPVNTEVLEAAINEELRLWIGKPLNAQVLTAITARIAGLNESFFRAPVRSIVRINDGTDERTAIMESIRADFAKFPSLSEQEMTITPPPYPSLDAGFRTSTEERKQGVRERFAMRTGAALAGGSE